MKRRVIKQIVALQLAFLLLFTAAACSSAYAKPADLLAPAQLAKYVGSTMDQVSEWLGKNGLSWNVDTRSTDQYIKGTVAAKESHQETVISLYEVPVKVQLQFMKLEDKWFFTGEIYYSSYDPMRWEKAVEDYGLIVDGLAFSSDPVTWKESPARYYNNPNGWKPKETYTHSYGFSEGWVIQEEKDFSCVKKFLSEHVLVSSEPYTVYLCTARLMRNFGTIQADPYAAPYDGSNSLDLVIQIMPKTLETENQRITVM